MWSLKSITKQIFHMFGSLPELSRSRLYAVQHKSQIALHTTHLETAVKRFQLSRRSTGSTGDQAATVALMQELSIISAMMRHHASSDTADWKPVTASGRTQQQHTITTQESAHPEMMPKTQGSSTG